MYKESEKKRSNEDEIDLGVVFNRIGAGIDRVMKGIFRILETIRKRILLILLLTLIGMGIGYGAFKVTKPYYTSSLTLIFFDTRNEFVESHLTNLAEMVSEDNYGLIAKYLEIEVDEAKQIKEMTFANLDQERVPEDSVLVGSPFNIEFMLYENDLFEVMEPALVYYLENNRYFSNQKRIRQRQLESLIEKYKREISSIDTIKTSLSSPRGPVNGFVYGEPLDPTKLYQESVSMYQEQIKLEAELDRLNNIEIVNGFTPRLNPTGPNLLKFLFIGGALAFVIGIITALVLESKKRRSLS